MWYAGTVIVRKSRFAIALLAAGTACDQQTPRNGTGVAPLTFVEEARFGWREMNDSTRPLTAEELRYQGGVLSNVMGLAEGADGRLYVLDRDFQKVVVFEPDGVFKAVILGGYGRGPGEFTFPRHLSSDDVQRLVVLDRGNMRLTLFAEDGVLESTDAIAFEALQALIYRDTAYLLDVPSGGRAAIRRKRIGDPAQSTKGLVLPDSRMAHFAAHGEPGALASSPEGVIYAHPSPGLWYEAQHGQWRGEELYPAVTGSVTSLGGIEQRYIRVGTRSIGVLPDGEIGLAYAHVSPPGVPASDTMMFVVIDPDGRPVGRGVLSDSVLIRHVLVSRRSKALYIAVDDPYPHVRKLRIVPGSMAVR